MNSDALFQAYYSQYRTVAQIPASTDDEYTIWLALANEAINRWANYDGTYWKELFTSPVLEDDTGTIELGVTQYDAPDDFKEAGGFLKIIDSNGNTVRSYPIIDPQEAQFKTDNSLYVYFSGNPSDGYTLNVNPAPDSSIDGMVMNYIYYKTPSLFTGSSSISEMSQPYFIVHRALANRFRGSRNPYYDSAKEDAEDVLKTMQMDNNSGSWANPWKLQDNSGSVWGQSSQNSFGV